MPRFTSEESKQRWLAAVRATRAKNKRVHHNGSMKHETDVAVVQPKIISPRPMTVNGNALTLLDAAIAKLQDDQSVLQQAREVIERLQVQP